MITIPDHNTEFILLLSEKYKLSKIVVHESFKVFTKPFINRVSKDCAENEGLEHHLHLKQLAVDLVRAAQKHGPFQISISDGTFTIKNL